VLGASTTGLAAAWYASRRGLSVAVVDRDVVVGGLAASMVVDGQRVDLGSHALHPETRPDLLADLKGLLGEELQWRQGAGRIRLDGRWLGFPFRPADLVRHASLRLAAGAARDSALAPWRRFRTRRAGIEPASFGARVRDELGPAVARALYEPYARKLWDADPDDLSPELFRRRLGPRPGARLVRRLTRRAPQAGYWYPSGGFGRIAEAMASDLVGRGGSVLLSTEASSVDASYHGVTVGLGDGVELRARTLVATTSPRALLSLFTESPLIVREAVQQMRHRAAVFVYLSVPMHRYTEHQAHHFPEPSTAVLRLSEPKSYRASSADPVGRTVLCAELPATVGDELWTLDDGSLAARVRADLLSAGLPDPRPATVHVERRAGAYAVHELGFERRQRVVDAWINGVPNVLAVQRQTLFALDNTHQALAMGEAVAGCLRRDGSVDPNRWREAQASFRAHLVEG
jgi:protoporphyrinogen oxidase